MHDFLVSFISRLYLFPCMHVKDPLSRWQRKPLTHTENTVKYLEDLRVKIIEFLWQVWVILLEALLCQKRTIIIA